MAVTNPDVHPYQGSSMFVVPVGAPGVTIVRDVGSMDDPRHRYGRFGNHAEIRYEDVRIPADHLIGPEGSGFVLAQARLGPGRIHHCMRWLGQSQRAFDMMCERALSSLHARLAARREADRAELDRRLARRDARRAAHDAARGVEDGPGGRVGRRASRSR